ncbi:MAG: hypothetical protein WB005_22470, partial [Pseudolabrys sp.]
MPDRHDAGAGEADGWVIAWSHIWAAPMLLDPSWRNGDYYGKAEPVAGLGALMLRMLPRSAESDEGLFINGRLSP